MIFSRSLLLILVLFPLFLHAGQIQNIDDMFSTCLNRDWENIKCNFQNDDTYIPSLASEYIGNPIFKLPRIIIQTFENIRKLNGPNATCSNSSESKMNLLSITTLLQHAVKTRKLSSCKAACMATCVSATLVKYDLSNSKMQTPCRILEDQKGGCAEFATFAVYFAREFGLKADIAYTASPAHNFAQVQIENGRYYMEPQDSSCTFY